MIQWQVLCKVLLTGNIELITMNGFKREHFFNYLAEYDFIMDHYQKYNKVPDTYTFAEKFPKDTIINVQEKDEYLIKQLNANYLFHKQILPLLKKGYDLAQQDSFKAIDYIRSEIENVVEASPITATNIAQDSVDSRLKTVQERKIESVFIPSGLTDLDDLIGGFYRDGDLIAVLGRTNMGKCFEKGTLVLMADGTKKKIEDIQIGDKVQSLNRINTVLATHNGISKGYKIIPGKGEPFVVSEDHIMTYFHKTDSNLTSGIRDLKIEDYIKLYGTKASSRRLLYRASVRYPERKNLRIPPFILGMWLGDGSSVRVELTNKDDVLIQEWYKYAQSLGLQVTKQLKKNSTTGEIAKACMFDITSGPHGSINQALDNFKSYNLIKNKHIPLEYLTSSKKQRLELLAGIIDTDGHINKQGTVEITTKSERLKDDYVQLIKGLGFYCNWHTHWTKWNYKDGSIVKSYFRISFSGPIHLIPTKLKKTAKINSGFSHGYRHTTFTIEPLERKIEYYGFQCDGDHRFLLADNTLVHNSWILMKLLEGAFKLGLRVGLYSGEMDVLLQSFRFDTLFGNINNTDLVNGNVNVQHYKDYLDKLKGDNKHFYVITPEELGGYATVTKLEAFVNKYKLDILAVDQLSLMEDDRYIRGQALRTNYDHITQDLFRLSCKKKIPILMAVQANRKSVEFKRENPQQEAPDIENASESDAIGHNSTKFISIMRKGDNLEFFVAKNRQGAKGFKILYNWDIANGIFKPIPVSGNKSMTDEQKIEEDKKAQAKFEDKGTLFG